MYKQGKIEKAWEELFNRYDIEKKIKLNGVFSLTAQQIKQTYEEPRLMTKFDSSSTLPKIFKDNNLSILPDSRGTYVIGKFQAYQQLDHKEIKPKCVQLPSWIRSFDTFQVTSEAVAINIAQISGMIDFLMKEDEENEPNCVRTITGRLKSGILNYKINLEYKNKIKQYQFKLNNSQVEIDAGFENINKLSIIEAKNLLPLDFMIRQLYYPFRIYSSLNTEKTIIPIFFTHADDIYSFYIFKFKDTNNYSSIEFKDQISFIVDTNLNINLDEVKQISHDSPNNDNKEPFPQADNFTRVLDVLQKLRTPKDKLELSDEYSFNPRQGDYYANASKYLGFVKKNGNKFELTNLGTQIVNLPNSNKRNLIIIKQILSNKIFNLIFSSVLKNNGSFDNDYITDVILKNVNNINPNTAKRRSKTAKNWIEWILNLAVV